MTTDDGSETLHDVEPLAQRLAALWAQASRTSQEAKRDELALARQLDELHTAHRQLARQGVAMPHSPAAERHRRHHVELLQSAIRELEAELEAHRAASTRLHAVAHRQLSSVCGALSSAASFPPARPRRVSQFVSACCSFANRPAA